VADRISAAVGDTGLERDLHAMARWKIPIAKLEQWVDEDAVKAIPVSGFEVAVDEHDVGDEYLIEVAEAEIGSTALNGCRAWIGLNGTEGQTMPGDHVGDCRERQSAAGKIVLLVRCSDPGSAQGPSLFHLFFSFT
jgi:hypothetical protein